MPQDKFIFVNAPTIVNAGPRDARRELRSQLMRRVYLKKYHPAIDEGQEQERGRENTGAVEERRPSRAVHSRISPPSDHDNDTTRQRGKQRKLASRSPPANLPTPPDDDAQEAPQQHHVSHQERTNARRKKIQTIRAKNRPIDDDIQQTTSDIQQTTGDTQQTTATSDPKPTIDPPFSNYFDKTFDRKLDPNCHVLIQHYSRVILPALRVGDRWRNNMFVEYVQTSPEPLLFHTLCLISSIHLDKLMLWNGVDAQRHRREYEQSYYKYVCLRELRQALAKPQFGTPGFDAVLVSLNMLSICDPVGDLDPTVVTDHNPFSHALLSLGALNIFGYEAIHAVHWAGLLTLMDQHGGFDSIRMYGAKWKIAYTAIKYSTHTNTKPSFPVCNELGESLVDYTPLEVLRIPPSSLPQFTGTGFQELKMFSIRDSILKTFVELGQLAHSMHVLMPYRDDIIVRDRLTDARNLVQYKFLNLPLITDDPFLIVDLPMHEDGKQGMHSSSRRRRIMEMASTVYGMCWLVSNLFTTHVTFPVPSCRRFRLKTVPPLYDIVYNCGPALKHHPVFMKLQLWCMVMCGIAAEDIDADLRKWMVMQTRDLCTKLGLREWEQVAIVMRSFAWMESACGYGGRKFWAEVQN